MYIPELDFSHYWLQRKSVFETSSFQVYFLCMFFSAPVLSVTLNVSLLGWELELMTINKMRQRASNKGALQKSQRQL